MKTSNTPEQIRAVVAALAKMHIRPFAAQSSDPKCNAQRNLNGKTHYVDDDTLRFHKSRVLSCRELHDGLLLRVVCSDAMDMHNTKRGFRAVVFDLFGTTVSRLNLADALSSKQAAINASERESIDLVAHYRSVLLREIQQHEQVRSTIN